MTTHTLYKPATTPTNSSIRKAKALSASIVEVRSEIEVITTEIESINSVHSRIVKPAATEDKKSERHLGVVKKEQNLLANKIVGLEAEIVHVREEFEKRTKELQAELTEAQAQNTKAAEITFEAEKRKKTTEANLQKAISDRDAEVADLKRREGERRSELRKAEYRLQQHLARHPDSDKVNETTSDLPGTAEEARAAG